MNLKDKIAKFEIELAELKAECSKQAVEYPLFMRSREAGIIVKFTGLKKGTVAWKGNNSDYNIGYTSNGWIEYTDTDTWEEVAYDKDRDLWDGQPVWCWYDVYYSHTREARFYDVVNKGVYTRKGQRNGFHFDNIEAVNPDHYEDWMIEAHSSLEK